MGLKSSYLRDKWLQMKWSSLIYSVVNSRVNSGILQFRSRDKYNSLVDFQCEIAGFVMSLSLASIDLSEVTVLKARLTLLLSLSATLSNYLLAR